MRKYKYENINWKIIQEEYNNHKEISISSLLKKYNIGSYCFNTARTKKLFIVDESRHYHHLHTEETKKILSEKRKEYLKNNPDKHPWKQLTKFKSEPCEKLKQILKDQNLEFIEEFSDSSWEHNYSIDIAFPNKKIGIEVNGNQHYNNDGTLKDYYLKRELYLNSLGWKIFQFHYSLVYNQNIIFDLIEKIKNNIHEITEEYNFFIKQKSICKICHKNSKAEICSGCKQKLERQKLIEKRKQIVLNSGIEFSKFGWVGKLSKLFNISVNKAGTWVKAHMPEFYKEKCFKRK